MKFYIKNFFSKYDQANIRRGVGVCDCRGTVTDYMVSISLQVWDLSVGSDWNVAACKVTMTGHLHTVRCLQVSSQCIYIDVIHIYIILKIIIYNINI